MLQWVQSARSAALAFAIVSIGVVQADGWRALTGEEISAALSERNLQYPSAKQLFYASGRTLYDAGGPSWGRWRVQGDQYCSVWPPHGNWACYDVFIDSAAARIRFVGAGNDVSVGEYVE
ncbi:MAG: hypothetical protein AAF499_15740 [Pseudomonadota bacterium]